MFTVDVKQQYNKSYNIHLLAIPLVAVVERLRCTLSRKVNRKVHCKKVKVSHSLIAVRAVGAVSWAQQIKDGAHPSSFPSLNFPDSKKVSIYCWVDKERFPVEA